jgi:putative transposase
MLNFKTVNMKKSRFTESQIVKALKEHEAGKKVDDICRELSINKQTLYNWKKKYSGMDVQHLKKLKELEEENRRLKTMYADLSLDHRILKDIVEKKL